ncbi:hypothetical protein KKH63_00970 [Patescibacteria group bacterium]|nr:hypothetical protein [Patescibacteria group bacterium]
MNFREFITKNKETVQVIYGVFLIILIPALIYYNTSTNVKNFDTDLNKSLQDGAVTAGVMFRSMIGHDIMNTELLQEKIDRISADNIDLIDISILAPEGDGFKIIASSKKDDIEKK